MITATLFKGETLQGSVLISLFDCMFIIGINDYNTMIVIQHAHQHIDKVQFHADIHNNMPLQY